jgi:hypothetical protein
VEAAVGELLGHRFAQRGFVFNKENVTCGHIGSACVFVRSLTHAARGVNAQQRNREPGFRLPPE